MKKSLILCTLMLLVWALPAQASDLAGVYTLSKGSTTLTLVIKQDPAGQLSGSLSSTTGARFVLKGVIKQGVGQGTLTAAGGGSYFQARRQGNQVQLILIEPNAQGQPDPSRARQLVLARQGSAGTDCTPPMATQPPAPPVPDRGVTAQPTPPPAQGAGAPPPPAPATGGPAAPAAGEIGHAQWGFAFRPPAGWQHRILERGVLLGSNQVAGIILVLPHVLGSLAEVQAEMLRGTNEGNTKMQLAGPLRRLGNNALVGDYQGFWEGQPAKGLGIGTLSPHGGGAMVIAVTTPDKFGAQLTGAAQAIAQQLRYFKVDVAALVKHFSGYWWRYSGTAQLSRDAIIHLAPDGGYRDRRETSANVTNRDYLGDVTSRLHGHSQSRARGVWTVRGTKEQGIIFVRRANGETFEIAYRVKPSRPQKYGSYYFNGRLHHWVTAKQLRDLGY